MPGSGWGEHPSASASVTRTAKWKRVRKKVLARDDGLCQIRGPNCTEKAAEVHHVVGVAEGGAEYDEDNLASVCSPCHWMLSGQEARARRLTTRRRPTPVHPVDVAGGPSPAA